jgi:GrpB-like predicted nucleotidyltransferase (UPF0157 family)
MSLTSSILPYDSAWPKKYDKEVARLIPIFEAPLVEFHHVGSTAVPELAAKPEIDILVVVNGDSIPDVWTGSLQRLGYRRGGDLSPGHHFFKRDIDGIRTHKIHICRDRHPKIAEMLKFRDHLRRHPDIRAEYHVLKFKLEKENTTGIGEYLSGKAPFIQAVLSAID